MQTAFTVTATQIFGTVDPATYSVTGESHYAEMVRDSRRGRRQLDGASTDWIVVRNRLSMMGSRNKRLVGEGLKNEAIADACRHVSQESIQLHGGIGVTYDLYASAEEMQAKMLQLESLGERVSGLALAVDLAHQRLAEAARRAASSGSSASTSNSTP